MVRGGWLSSSRPRALLSLILVLFLSFSRYSFARAAPLSAGSPPPASSAGDAAGSRGDGRPFAGRRRGGVVVYGLLSVRDLERAARRMSSAGSSHVLGFLASVRESRARGRPGTVALRRKVKASLSSASGSFGAADEKSYLACLRSIKEMKAGQEEREGQAFLLLLRRLSSEDRGVLAEAIFVPGEGKSSRPGLSGGFRPVLSSERVASR